MPKKRAENNVLTGNLKDSYIVQKSEPLLLMRTVPFELGELKILDTYLARINSHDEKGNTVVFTKAEYEQLMGLQEVSTKALRKYTDKMMGKIVELPIPDDPDGYNRFILFSKSKCMLNEYGQRIVTLTCTEEAKQIFFNIEALGYLRYELKNVLRLTSKHSYLLYLYLRKERYRGIWEIELDELKRRLDIKSGTYNEFKYFNRDVLDKAIKEVSAKTDITYAYETIKRNKTVVAIRFSLVKENNTELVAELEEPNPDQLTLDELYTSENLTEDEQIEQEFEKQAEQKRIETLNFFNKACSGKFSVEDIDTLQQIVRVNKDFGVVKRGDLDFKIYHYLEGMFNQMMRQDKVNQSKGKKPIEDFYKYILKMIKKDLGVSK